MYQIAQDAGVSQVALRLRRTPETDFVLDYHLVGARTTLDLFGIAGPLVFDDKLRKAG